MRYLKIVVAVLVIIVGVIFVLQNKDLQRSVELGFDPVSLIRGSAQETPAEPAAEEGFAAGQESGPAAEVSGKNGIPVFVLVFIAFFVGILVASIYGMAEKYRLKRVVKATTRRVRDLEEELKRLRNLPLTQAATQPRIPTPPSQDLGSDEPQAPAKEED
ncbi:MAG: LapA family protein [Deltaproteobacteria bacterium]|nr:LapA family protein [Deltaproteobacteria bacterium]